MDEVELTRLLLGNQVTSPYFCGVISHDQLNLRQTPETGFYICNTDDSNGPGEHWLALVWTNKGPVEFFDSLAKPPSHYDKDFVNFMIDKGPDYKYSTKRIQAVDSIMCGEFCVFYSYHRCKGYSMEHILTLFSDTHLKYNDVIVNSFVNKM